MRFHLPRRVLVLGLVAAVVVAGAAVWRFALRDSAEPASVDDAVARFRELAEGNAGRIPPGVYVYRTKGFESVSALGGVRHRYPARSTITVTRAGCGSTLRWDVLRTRSNTLTICPEEDGLRLASLTERHVFFGQDDRTDWRCTGLAWLPPSPKVAEQRWRCRSSDSTMAGTLSVVAGEDTVPVGGRPVRALHLRVDARESGGARGPLVEDRWLERETGLPLRIAYRVRTENPSPIGDVTFVEEYELRLLSLEPRR